ncbi:MAG TPA: histidine phosphatase family protein, partial [Chlamydiales bacterium]|nr:histidine phosphatase family protein [Chlamydiales bacterium]
MKFLIPALLCFGAAQAETHFLYVRHGEVPGNDPSHYLYTGSGTNESLTEKGKSQAEECARTLSEIQKSGRALAAIYSSNLNRAVETAR